MTMAELIRVRHHKYTSKKTYTVKITLFDTATPGAKLTITSMIKVV